MQVDLTSIFTFTYLTCANSEIENCKIDSYPGTSTVTKSGTDW